MLRNLQDHGRSWFRNASIYFLCGLLGLFAVLSFTAERNLGCEAEPIARSKVAVVCPKGWESALTDWTKYRSSNYDLVLLESDRDPNQIRAKIIDLARQPGSVEAVLLCGGVFRVIPPETTNNLSEEEPDPNSPKEGLEGVLEIIVPTFIAPTRVRLGTLHTETLSTDAPFGDMDGDGCPDIAVGRVPAKSPAELHRMLARSIAYEGSEDLGQWRDQVHVTAGVGGFGALADTAIESVTRRYLSEGIPDRFHLQMTYASLNSPYCPDPRRLRETFLGKLNRGGMFWVYIGHGWVDSLDVFRYGEHEELICRAEDAPSFDAPIGPPIAVMLACFTGAIDAKVDCFAERLLAQPNGPIAVIAGTRVTMPYGLSEFAGGMLESCFVRETPTLGKVLLESKRAMWDKKPEDTVDLDNPARSASAEGSSNNARFRSMIQSMAQVLSPEDHDLCEERREHVRLMNLLGDPLLRIRHPQKIELQGEETLVAGEVMHFEGTTPWDGAVKLELLLHRDRPPAINRSEVQGTGEEALYGSMQNVYEQANHLILCEAHVTARNGRFSGTFKTDASYRGKYVVRARMESDSDWAVGTKRISLQRPKVIDRRKLP